MIKLAFDFYFFAVYCGISSCLNLLWLSKCYHSKLNESKNYFLQLKKPGEIKRDAKVVTKLPSSPILSNIDLSQFTKSIQWKYHSKHLREILPKL